MTTELRKLLTDWLAWAEAGAPEHPLFHREFGLCAPVDAIGVALSTELMVMFRAGGLNTVYPFGEREFDTRLRAETQHEDPNRLAWVRSKIAETVVAA